MKICVIGAGAIGGLLAARLSRSGASVSVVARGAHLAAIRSAGLVLIGADGSSFAARVAASDRIADFGAQDLVILGMKSYQVADIADQLGPLLAPETAIIPAQNGIPWWYFHKCGGPYEGVQLKSVDPDGRLAASIPLEHVIATVVYPAAEIVQPGVIRHVEGERFSLSELDGEKSARIERISHAFREAGFKAPIVSDIRSEIWTKLWGNLSLNPISALTHATLGQICADPGGRALAMAMMREAQKVGEAVGARFKVSIEKRIAGAEAIGDHKTSMLQDIESGRALETEALFGAVLELARLTETATPICQAVYALVKLLEKRLDQRGRRLRLAPLSS